MELDKWAVLVRDKLKQQPVDLYSGFEVAAAYGFKVVCDRMSMVQGFEAPTGACPVPDLRKLLATLTPVYSGTEAVPFEALNRVYLSLLEIWPINGEHPLIEVDPHAE